MKKRFTRRNCNLEYRKIHSRLLVHRIYIFIEIRIFFVKDSLFYTILFRMYSQEITNVYHQFQAIGNNYNQTVRAVKANFGDKRAFALVAKLEKATLELVVLSKQIIALTREFEERHLNRKSGG